MSIIEISELNKSYGPNDVLENIDLRIDKGTIFGILGRNGVGKTTFLECLVGLRKPDSGTIRILDFDVLKNRKQVLEEIGVQPQEASLLNHLTVYEILKLFSSFYRKSNSADQILSQMSLEDIGEKKINTLSVGQKRRLLVGLALIPDPQIVVLDEPTSGVDPQIRVLIWEAIRTLKNNGRTVILSTHFMDEANQLCDTVGILHEKKFIVCGSPEDIINTYSTNEKTLENAFINITGHDLRGGLD
ncbi:ABC transporter ATP-binding protein [Bacillus horti]|uniref:ABC-2 type transport system ATP-binding protein n=1 Tax=Caldalkalibacillus horti TaxID=77523 RepID=A0ABT9W3F3_9BACI|nr:ABC transporter ATP-binding protein [Bacillus horti]MDQ0167784.1 ABC-2 type transport system ATP-binding protein [Bacillus horti]